MSALKFIAGAGVIIIGIGTICLPMVTTSWIGILGNFDFAVCAGVITALVVLHILLYMAAFYKEIPPALSRDYNSMCRFILVYDPAQESSINQLSAKQVSDKCNDLYSKSLKDFESLPLVQRRELSKAMRELSESKRKHRKLCAEFLGCFTLIAATVTAATVFGIMGLVLAYKQIATLNSALPIMSAATLKTSIFGNILYAATEATVGGSESAIMASIAHSPLMMGLAPEVAFGIWDGIFFPLAGIVVVVIGAVLISAK